MTRVLVVNRGVATDNRGDQAINYTICRLFETRNCDVETANYTKLFEKRSGARGLKNAWDMIKIAKREFDYTLIGGGQLVLGNHRFPLALLSWVLIMKMFSRSKVILFGVGVDSNFKGIKKHYIKFALKFVDQAFVRDGQSKENLEKYFQMHSSVIPDVVTVISNFLPKEELYINQRFDVLFGITQYGSIKRYDYLKVSEEQYFEQQALQLIEYSKQYDSIAILCNTAGDHKEAVKFAKFIKERFKIVVPIFNHTDLKGFISGIANSSLVVSSRMHSLIISGSYGIPFIPVIRNLKLESFAKDYIPFKPVHESMLSLGCAMDMILNSNQNE
jgi:polysaccharide pyruvyl transferase WcaK-like protein